MWRKLLEEGYPIVSSWIHQEDINARQMQFLWDRIDEEILTATCLVLYTDPDDGPIKTAMTEVGMALARGVPVFVVAGDAEALLLWSLLSHPNVAHFNNIKSAMYAATIKLQAPKNDVLHLHLTTVGSFWDRLKFLFGFPMKQHIKVETSLREIGPTETTTETWVPGFDWFRPKLTGKEIDDEEAT
jgi:hypothetical protein